MLKIVFLRITGCAHLAAASRCLSVSAVCSVRRPVLNVPEPPKRPVNAYALFVKDNYARTPGEKAGEVMVEVAKMWRTISAEEKQHYVDQYERQKKQYKIEMEEFLAGIGDEEAQKEYLDKVSAYKKARTKYIKHFRLKKLGLLKPRPVTGRNLYVSSVLKDAPYSIEERKDIFKNVSDKWTALTTEEQQRFVDKASTLNTTRLAEYEARLKEAKEKGIIKEEPPKKPAKKPGRKKVAKKATKTAKKGTKKRKTAKKATTKRKTASGSKTKKTSSKTASKTSKTKDSGTKRSTQGRQFSTAMPQLMEEEEEDVEVEEYEFGIDDEKEFDETERLGRRSLMGEDFGEDYV